MTGGLGGTVSNLTKNYCTSLSLFLLVQPNTRPCCLSRRFLKVLGTLGLFEFKKWSLPLGLEGAGLLAIGQSGSLDVDLNKALSVNLLGLVPRRFQAVGSHRRFSVK